MSEKWSALSGTAVILTQLELETLIDRYNSVQNDDIDLSDEDLNLEDLIFKAPFNHPELAFSIMPITEDRCDGMLFEPYTRYADNQPNLCSTDEDADKHEIYTWRTGTCYAIFTVYPLEGPGAFHYSGIEDIREEFESRLFAYLPRFHWAGRIGAFSCAIYE